MTLLHANEGTEALVFLEEVLLHGVLDTLKLIPFLFLTYLLMEFIEHKASGISYAFLTNTSNYRGASFTNSLGTMIRNAMSRVQEWPTDRDLFVEVPNTEEPGNES